MATERRPPTRDAEDGLRAQGHQVVVGIDEVGKGAWAGPLAVGVALVPADDTDAPIRDSKSLTEKAREKMFDTVASWCTAWAVGMASPRECDEWGMSEAQRVATRRALESLGVVPDAAVVDGSWDFVSPLVGRVQMVVKADTSCLSVAAASILAKVTRDRLMREMALELPMYRFDGNKGYPCQWHRSALAGYGPSSEHRTSWAFMDEVPWPGSQRRERSLTLFEYRSSGP
ncbi:MAG: ribonuclease [Actinomycetota bacterium]|jgi:ribonuclease HII